jgi:xanthine dehydrogenase YagS FAD-binding subunit
MQSFEWVDAASVEQAAALLAEGDATRPVVAKAGGMDLLDLMKEGIISPSRVVNLKSIKGLDDVRFSEAEGLDLGALVTLSRVANAPEVRQRYAALAGAAGHVATPQVRNTATIGGNLLQRPRCWYFRNAYFHHSGADSADHARDGENQYHAIFDNARSAMVHASTPATALLAYGARVELTGPQGKRREVALQDFLLSPEMTRDRDTLIEAGEVLTRVRVPPPAAGTRAAYHKQTERDSYDWPLCDVAVVLRLEGRRVRAASIVMGWVAPTPRRAVESERVLVGRDLSENVVREASRAAVAGATPLSKNAYKVPVLEAVVRRTVLAAAAA